jgi:hypothetical protein
MRFQPALLAPNKQTTRVVQVVKNFAKTPGVCHIGLGVTALNNAKTMRRIGWHVEAWPAQNAGEVRQKLKAAHVANGTDGHPVTHVLISAPSWINAQELQALSIEWPDVEFVQQNHSGAAFLGIDAAAVKNIRASLDLSLSCHNVRVASNCARVATSLSRTFGAEVLFVPNLYDVSAFMNPYPMHREIGGTLRIGSFGASRPYKNQFVAATAAVEMARQLGLNLELYVNSGRGEGNGSMIRAREELFDGLRGCKLIEVPWEPWPRFRKTCGSMHLLLQPSFSETFNVVTADGIAEGVASVTSAAIEWSPRYWQAETDDPNSLVQVGLSLLNNKYAVEDGRAALTKYVQDGIREWERWLLRS